MLSDHPVTGTPRSHPLDSEALNWRLDAFSALTPFGLHEILRARVNIFVVEQSCPYPELDDEDFTALHLQAWSADGLSAYARILPPDDQGRVWIGRVLVSESRRRSGLGRLLMQRAIAATDEHFPAAPVWLGAQLRLRRFYEGLGFQAEGKPYLEDEIPHLKMARNPSD